MAGPPSVWLTLTEGEMAYAEQVAERRNSEAKRMKLADKHGYQGQGGDVHLLGAAGEYAAAIALRRHWDGSVNTFKRGGDVGSYQIRTRSKPHYDLLVRKDDRPGDCFFLVIGEKPPTFEIAGWAWGRDAMMKNYLQTHGGREPAFFMPRSALRPIHPAFRPPPCDGKHGGKVMWKRRESKHWTCALCHSCPERIKARVVWRTASDR